MVSCVPHRFAARQLSIVAIILAFAITGSAQSGRRSTKPVEKAKAAPQVSLLVSIEDRNPFSNIPYYLADGTLDACIDRLRDSSELSVVRATRGMDRADVVHRSKDEKSIYVVWLQLVGDIPLNKKIPKNGPEELYVRYTIFEPATARVIAEGRNHLAIYRTSVSGVSSQGASRNSPVYSEYALKQAARDVAELVMRAFEITPPEERSPR